MGGTYGLPIGMSAALLFGWSNSNHAERPTTVANLLLAANVRAWQYFANPFAYVGPFNVAIY